MMVFTIAVTEFSCSQNAEVRSSKVSDSTTNASKTQECPYKFLGIPIEGSMDAFAQKLEQKGFKSFLLPSTPGRFFSGVFYEYNVLIALISGQVDEDNLWRVRVVIRGIGNNVSDAINIYMDFRSGLIKQYQYNNKGWILEDRDDIGTLSTYEIQQALDRGTQFQFSIEDPSVTTFNGTYNLYYIVLTLYNDSLETFVTLDYYNPILSKKLLETVNLERSKDL